MRTIGEIYFVALGMLLTLGPVIAVASILYSLFF